MAFTLSRVVAGVEPKPEQQPDAAPLLDLVEVAAAQCGSSVFSSDPVAHRPLRARRDFAKEYGEYRLPSPS
jgi:hypothetical protein